MAMDVDCERWRFLEPWCAHLRGRVTLDARVRHVASRTRTASWLCVALPPDGKGDNWRLVAHLREAVELLAAVARADAASLRWLLARCCGVVGIEDEESGDASELLQAPRFSLAFRQYATALDISWGATLFHQFFLALDHAALSAAFRAAMARVQRMGVGQRVQPPHGPRIRVEIAFAPPELPPHWSLPFLTSVREVVQAIRDEADNRDGGDNAFPFALDSVRLNANHVKLSKKTLPVLADLFALGVTVPLLSLHGSTTIAKAPRHYMGQFVTAMMRCVRSGDESGGDAGGVRGGAADALRLRGPGVDSHQFGAFCSALATARGVDSVQLSEVFTEERGYHRFIKWQWAAYAFFWRAIVRATYPAKALLRVDTSDLERAESRVDDDDDGDGRRCEQPQQVVSVLLNKGTRVHIDPYDPFDRRSFELEADDHFLVMKDVPSGDFVEILVPGYAHCAVARDVVQYYLCNSEDARSTTEPRAPGRPARSPVTSLHLEFKRAVQANTLQAFIKLVGAPLESLVLKARALSSETLNVVLRACPRLTRLSIDIVAESALKVLAQAYATSECQIASLSLQGLELESDEVSDFAHALGSSESAIAKRLDELVIGERVESFALDESNLVALLAMLGTNAKLEYLELYVENALFDNFLPLFSEFHGQALPVLREHIPLASRLAFLSVLETTRSVPEKRELHAEDADDAEGRAPKRVRRHSSGSSIAADTSRLDRHVLSLIFHFAALRKQRVVKLVKFH
ncbi:hypothetical protein PybrP1_013089 [[Pythium] brassicae (nom. inval.)]|nr:hypothetical protein PybrP1_013089 [[Pythium] brassicae (nom. inval.)]